MGIYDRLSVILRANINDIIDGAEDPEKMINQYVRELESSIQEARPEIASMIAQSKMIEEDQAEAEKLAAAWHIKAQRALESGREDLAREALRRERDSRENAEVYAEQLRAQNMAVERMKGQLSQLESRYDTLLSQRDMLITRAKRAKSQKELNERIEEFSPYDPTQDLQRMERKIRQNEAEAAAMFEMTAAETTLDEELNALDYDDQIESELGRLKAAIDLGAPKPIDSGQD